MVTDESDASIEIDGTKITAHFRPGQNTPTKIVIEGGKLENRFFRSQNWGALTAQLRALATTPPLSPAVRKLVDQLLTVDLRLISRQGKMALAAALYIDAVREGAKAPNQAVAERMQAKVASVTTWQRMAREEYLDAPEGAVGGTLTEEGVKALRKAVQDLKK